MRHHPHRLRAALIVFCTIVRLCAALAGDCPQTIPELRSTPPRPVLYYDAGIFRHEEPAPVRTWGARTSYTATINVSRYYGNQQERARQMELGLMPKYAILSILAGDCDINAVGVGEAPEIDRVFFNGRELGILTGKDDAWILNTFRVPCQEVNFPSAPGEIGENQLEIIVDSGNSVKTWYLDQIYQTLDIPAPWPVLLVHGWTTDDQAMGNLQGLLSQIYGLPSELADVPMENSPQKNGELLEEQLEMFTASYGVSKFNLVAHSKGGLDSRALIDQSDVNSPHVNHLFQIATPNAGSHLADILIDPDGFTQNFIVLLAKLGDSAYWEITDGLKSLTPAACEQFNRTHHSPNAPISTVIGRVRDFHPFDDHDDDENGWDWDGGWDYYRLGRFSYGHDYHSNDPQKQGDGIVSVPSAHALGTQVAQSPLDSNTTMFSHSNIIRTGARTVLSVFQPMLLESPRRPAQPQSPLRSGTAQATANAAVPLPAKTAAAEFGTGAIPATRQVKNAFLEPRQETRLLFDLTDYPAPKPEFLFLRAPASLQIRVASPDGTIQEVPANQPNAETDPENLLEMLGGRVFTLENATAGVYAVLFANPEDEPLCVTVCCEAQGKRMEMEVTPVTDCLPGMTCAFTVSLLKDGVRLPQPGLPLQCRCRLLREDADRGTETTTDEEIPLEYIGDGYYRGSFIPPEEGEYLLSVLWLDSCGEPAMRSQTRLLCCPVIGTLCIISAPGEKIPGVFSPTTAGIWSASPDEQVFQSQSLRFPVDATVSQAGQYCLSAALYSQTGQCIATSARRQDAAKPGKLHFELDFDGAEIYSSQTDGPYWLDDLQLCYLAENGGRKVLANGMKHLTGHFSYQDFLHAPMNFVGIAKEWLETRQEDVRDSRTTLHLLANVEVAKGLTGPHRFGATLSSTNGLALRSVDTGAIDFQETADADAVMPIEFVFDTGDLLERGIPGPYCLDGLYALSEKTGKMYYCPGEAMTAPYQLDQFEYYLETVRLRDVKGFELAWTSVPDDQGLYSATLTFTRFDYADGGPRFFLAGAPLLGPFGIAVAEDHSSGIQIVHAQSLSLASGNCQYLDCDANALDQLHHQGNHDDWLDAGETLTLLFQYTQDTPTSAPPPICLMGKMLTPPGRQFTEHFIRHCLITDLNQDFRITSEEADAARQRWENGEISHSILLQTIEFSKAPGYRYSPTLNDFEPLK